MEPKPFDCARCGVFLMNEIVNYFVENVSYWKNHNDRIPFDMFLKYICLARNELGFHCFKLYFY